MRYLTRQRPQLLNQAGDTIVEVMIVLAVLGLSFAISYATANRGLIQSRIAEEHSEATGILNSQIELVRSAVNHQTEPSSISGSFCIPDPSSPTNIHTFGGHTVPATAAADSAAGYPYYSAAGCVSGLYHKSVTYKPNIDPSQSYLDFLVRWDGLGGLGPQQEEITYKISTASIAGAVWTNPAPIINPSLAVSGGTGPAGAFYPTDTVTIAVGGLGTGDTCQIKDATSHLYLSACNGSFPASNLPANATTNLTAYVTDSGAAYTSNTVAVKTISAAPVWSSWMINGSGYSSCSAGEAVVGDGRDGCFTTGTSMYALRAVNVTYNFASGTYSPSGSTVPAGTAYLFVNYNQQNNGYSLPPSDYSYSGTIVITYGDGSTSTAPFSLPIRSNNSSYDQVYSSAIPITFSKANPSSITLKWTNNTTKTLGGDANLQINQLQLSKSNAGFSTGSYSAPGNGYSSCSAGDPNACGTTGTSVYAYQPNMSIFYPVIRNLSTSSTGKYNLTLNYSNYNLNGHAAPPNYSYSVNVYVNGQLVKLWSLPDTLNSATTTFTLSSPNISPDTVQVLWINDNYYCSGNVCYDANFQLNSFTLTTK